MLARNITGGTPHECSIKLSKDITLYPGEDVDISVLRDNTNVQKALAKYQSRGWVELKEKPKPKKKKRKTKPKPKVEDDA